MMSEQELEPRFNFIHRVAGYSWVNYLSETAKDYYAYAKESNSYVKRGLETAESYSQPIITKLDEYSHQPFIEHVISNADEFGCRQLDKVENGAQSIKQSTNQTVERAAEKIHGTTVESLIIKTVDVVDKMVDSLLPPQNEEEEEEADVPEDPNVVERTSPVIRKLKTRISKDSIMNLPSQTYHEVRDLVFRSADSHPNMQICIGLLINASQKILEVKDNTKQAASDRIHQGAELSKARIDHAYSTLNHMMEVMTSLIAHIKQVNVDDAKATLVDVHTLIQESKNRVMSNNANIKEDISHILKQAGDLLANQVAIAHDKASHSDYATVRKATQTLEVIMERLLEKFEQQ